MKIISLLNNLITSGSERSIIIKKNVTASLVIKGLSIITTLLLVPLTIDMLDEKKYGIWITLFSIVTWFNMMDIGLGNGFRNKFATAVALNQIESARKLTETIYASTILISITFFLIYSLIHPFIDWHIILNIPYSFNENISNIVYSVFGLFSLQLILKNISSILLALQKTAQNDLIIFLGNFIALVSIFILGQLELADLSSISLIFMISPLFTYLIFSFFLFRNKLKPFYPVKISFEKKYFNEIMNLGIKFFFIQITTIVMFSSGNFIITQLYGPEQVTPYNVSYRLFSSTMSIFMIIIAPFWSAYTEAITRTDFIWIRNSLKKLREIWIVFIIGLIILFITSPIIYGLWIGDQVDIPLFLSASFALYIGLLSWSGMYAQFLNGVGKIKIQLIIAIIQCITNIPLAIVLAKYLNLGISGVIMATNINLFISAIVLPIQVRKISEQRATGVWNM